MYQRKKKFCETKKRNILEAAYFTRTFLFHQTVCLLHDDFYARVRTNLKINRADPQKLALFLKLPKKSMTVMSSKQI